MNQNMKFLIFLSGGICDIKVTGNHNDKEAHIDSMSQSANCYLR